MKQKQTEAQAGPKYPHIKVQINGEDGNAFAIMSRVVAALRRAGVPKEERDAFFKEVTASAYDGVIQTAMKWVDVA